MGGSSYCRGPPKSAAMHALRFDTKGATATAAEVTHSTAVRPNKKENSQPCDAHEFTESEC